MASLHKLDSDFVFPAPGGRGRDHRATSRAITRLFKRAGLEDGVSFHNLRKSFGSHLFVNLGWEAATVTEMMGHTDTRTTLRHYVRSVDKDAARERQQEQMSAGFRSLLASS
jgi:integrase